MLVCRMWALGLGIDSIFLKVPGVFEEKSFVFSVSAISKSALTCTDELDEATELEVLCVFTHCSKGSFGATFYKK